MATTTKDIKTLDRIKKMVKSTNEFVLETTEDAVEKGFARGAQWQKIGAKALKEGFDIVEKQADLTFSALESIKEQWIKGQKKFKARFQN